LSVEKGIAAANGKRLASFPPLSWVHFEIKSRIGEDADGTWDDRVFPRTRNFGTAMTLMALQRPMFGEPARWAAASPGQPAQDSKQ
jgi:hypothetical protein